jgi:hypothetical protein
MNRGFEDIRKGRTVLDFKAINGSWVTSPLDSVDENHSLRFQENVHQAEPVCPSFHDPNFGGEVHFHQFLGHVDPHSFITEEEVAYPQDEKLPVSAH